MKTSKIVLIFVILIVNEILAVPFDTGYITWIQPNKATFIARSWGDEFESWMETDDGYQIILGPDYYYYYAVLDENGEFTFSNYKVAIDEPLQDSYQLERSPEQLDEIVADIEAFDQQLQNNFERFINDERFNGTTPASFRLAVVLVDFTPSHKRNDPPLVPPYLKEYFDTLFFSTGFYFTINENLGPKSPDDEYVYGSLRDYYKDQSLGRLNIIGKLGDDRSIINPPDLNNPTEPRWVIMPESWDYYDSNFSVDEVMLLVKQKAEEQLPDIDFNYYDAICFMYAGDGNEFDGGLLAAQRHGNIFASYEQYVQSFAHIGIPAHEFAHVIGAADQYKGDITTGWWSLMSLGLYNGNDLPNPPWGYTTKGNYPAPFEPEYRIRFNWVTPIVLEPQENFIVQYNYSSPYFYKIYIPGSSEYFIIERRRKDGYDRYTPEKEVAHISDPPKGILIWHIALDVVSIDEIELEYANGSPDPQANNRFPNPSTSIQNFNDLTTPSAKKRNGDNSFISINNIEWIGNQQTGYAELDYILEALEITGTQTWSTNMYLALPVYIRDGGTLNIINGADVYINGDFAEQVKIVVEDGGTLNLLGSENNKVVLRTGDIEQPIQKWHGIEIYGNGIFESNFAIIQDALNPINVLQDNAYSSLNNTEIIGNAVALNGNVIIENSIFYGASLLINKSNNGSKIKRTIFFSQLPNELFVQISYPGVSYLEVANCTFNGMKYGLEFGRDENTFGDRTNQITVRNNIFSNCNRSIELYAGDVSISFNNFYNNNYDDFMGSSYLTVNPLYIEPGNNDFNIQWGSGCIDAGHTSPVYNDPDGTRNDMGAKYYDQSPADHTCKFYCNRWSL